MVEMIMLNSNKGVKTIEERKKEIEDLLKLNNESRTSLRDDTDTGWIDPRYSRSTVCNKSYKEEESIFTPLKVIVSYESNQTKTNAEKCILQGERISHFFFLE